jgi:hypothetical protein
MRHNPERTHALLAPKSKDGHNSQGCRRFAAGFIPVRWTAGVRSRLTQMTPFGLQGLFAFLLFEPFVALSSKISR